MRRARRGKQGGGWSNVSEVLHAEGQRIVYVKGGSMMKSKVKSNKYYSVCLQTYLN